MLGLIVRFNLKDAEAAQKFDALVAEISRQVESSEPGTLLYVVNTVEGAPLSRIFYEVYADGDAFEAHEATGHIKYFLNERERYITDLRVEFVTPVSGKNRPDVR
ncbi:MULTISPECIES: putative quinol monooxygenase [unclassified Pseudonocardia]|uniref:putative quinol monooxygenase n=1 Tax=unclassified Pseudonocardia TaxID=2619320 RepID=UPI00094B2769|nr:MULTISPECIES: antibiotic biosynthesis monooxygenase [unclassified Pseudonocardia]